MGTYPVEHFVLDCRGKMLDCRPGIPQGAQVIGILNVTPDSFSDGGAFLEVDAALRQAEAMLAEGAAIIDVGGESTRPRGTIYGAGAARVEADEERRRVLPVIEAIAQRFPEAIISVDTYKPAVAADALAAGAHVLNDVTGLRNGTEMAEVAGTHSAPLIVMHSLGQPGEMPHEHAYQDVVQDVKTSLVLSIQKAEAAGVRQVVVDPGFGFGKSPAENLRLLNRADRLLELGRPVLVGISRKSSIGKVLASGKDPVPMEQRLFGTLGATAVAVLRGATLVRTHDVRPTVEMLRVLAATAAAE
jgi:dihydropteroate synthase